MRRLGLLELAGDILLHMATFLEVEDAISFSMVSRGLHDLFRNYARTFWIGVLTKTRVSRPIPCPPADDITKYDTSTLRNMARHFDNLNRNWKDEKPRPVGRVRTLTVDKDLDSIAQIPGTKYVITHSIFKCTLSVWSTENGKRVCSIDANRRIAELSAGWPERGRFTIAMLAHHEFNLPVVDLQVMVVDYSGPKVVMDYIFLEELEHADSRRYRAVFLNSDVVGVLYMNNEENFDGYSPFHVFAFNMKTGKATDIRVSLDWGSNGGPYYDEGDTYHAWIPQNLLPYTENSDVAAQTSYTLTPTYLESYLRPSNCPSTEDVFGIRTNFGVIASTVYPLSITKPATTGIIFWIIDSHSLTEAERTGSLPVPTPSPPIVIPGTINRLRPSSWCLNKSTDSGVYLILSLEDGEKKPKVVVVRLQLPDYRFTVHIIETPPYVKHHLVSGFFVDECRGTITLYVPKGRMFVLDYA